MNTLEQIAAARLAEEAETQGSREFCRNRLARLTDAVRDWTIEDGATDDQDELLFVAGFRNELRHASTSCGFTVDIKREADGRLLASIPTAVWLGAFNRRSSVFVSGVGVVEILTPTDEELADYRLREALGPDALRFLPSWAREAVRAAFVERSRGVQIDELPPSPLVVSPTVEAQMGASQCYGQLPDGAEFAAGTADRWLKVSRSAGAILLGADGKVVGKGGRAPDHYHRRHFNATDCVTDVVTP